MVALPRSPRLDRPSPLVTGGTASLVKLVLSLWNAACGFSFRECIHNLAEDHTALALRMVGYFAAARTLNW